MLISTIAIVRDVSRSMARCALTHVPREPIDLDRARAQHHHFETLLAALGCQVERLKEESDLPDAVFVEDTAVVFDEVAVIARPGAESRRSETASVAQALALYRPLVRIEPPGTLDGGDVLRVGRRVFVGASARTNREGRAQLRALLEPLGYAVEEVPVRGCLHLKSAATEVGPETVLLNPAWVDPAAFGGLSLIEIAPEEPFSANALRVGNAVIHPAAFPRTRERLGRQGIDVRAVDVSELAKAEGGVTCCALLIEAGKVDRVRSDRPKN